MYQRVVFGPLAHAELRGMPDLDAREIIILVPVLVLIVWIGVYPRPFTAVTEQAVAELIQTVKASASGLAVAAAPRP
jgi:NADH-quinone oxidoreductase subunit M